MEEFYSELIFLKHSLIALITKSSIPNHIIFSPPHKKTHFIINTGMIWKHLKPVSFSSYESENDLRVVYDHMLQRQCCHIGFSLSLFLNLWGLICFFLSNMDFSHQPEKGAEVIPEFCSVGGKRLNTEPPLPRTWDTLKEGWFPSGFCHLFWFSAFCCNWMEFFLWLSWLCLMV